MQTPRDTVAYIDAVATAYDAEPCVYGHYGCALHFGGPCSDELVAALPDLYDEVQANAVTFPVEEHDA
jgi:hypothetical protein